VKRMRTEPGNFHFDDTGSSVKISKHRGNFAHDRAEAMTFCTEFDIKVIIVRLLRSEKTFDERPVSRQKSL